MRLIDADALDEAFTRLRFDDKGEIQHWGDRKDWCLHGCEIEKLIVDAPTIEAEPVRRGRWLLENIGKPNERCVCSECGTQVDSDEAWHYCPNCGAKMEEQE